MFGSAPRLMSLLTLLLAVVALLSLSVHRMDLPSGSAEAAIAGHAAHGVPAGEGEPSTQIVVACAFHCITADLPTEAAPVMTRVVNQSDLVEPSRWLSGRTLLPLGPPPKLSAFA